MCIYCESLKMFIVKGKTKIKFLYNNHCTILILTALTVLPLASIFSAKSVLTCCRISRIQKGKDLVMFCAMLVSFCRLL